MLGHSEIDHSHAVRAVDHDVLSLDVAMAQVDRVEVVNHVQKLAKVVASWVSTVTWHHHIREWLKRLWVQLKKEEECGGNDRKKKQPPSILA